MKFTITNFESKVSAKGTAYARLSVKDETGAVYDNVAMFKGLSGLQNGSVVDGTLEHKEYNGKPSYTLMAGNLGAKPAWVANKQGEVSKSVEKAQNHKDESILTSSTFRDATSITVAMTQGKNVDAEEVKKAWLRWRKWLVTNYESMDGTDKTEPPF